MLVLDSGNALFKTTSVGGAPREKERATFILEQMDALGTVAMAVGARDLTLGTDFLLQAARGRKMKLLSANLADLSGKLFFPASTVVTVGGVKFGLVGLSPEGPQLTRRDIVGGPTLPAALAEARRLRQKEKVDVVVVLAAIPYMEADTLAEKAGDAVDFVLQSNNGQNIRTPLRSATAWLVASGDRGRQVARLALSVEGQGPFADLSQADQARESLRLLDQNLQTARTRMAETRDPALQKTWRENVASLEARRQTLLKQGGEGKGALKRTDRKSTRLNSSHSGESRMPSSA